MLLVARIHYNLPKLGPSSKTSQHPFFNEVVAKGAFSAKVRPPIYATVHVVMQEALKKEQCVREGTQSAVIV